MTFMTLKVICLLFCFCCSDLQMTDVELDARVTVLEENGGGNTLNGNNLNALMVVFLLHSFVIVSLKLVAEIPVHFVYVDKFSMQIYIPLIVKYELNNRIFRNRCLPYYIDILFKYPLSISCSFQ